MSETPQQFEKRKSDHIQIALNPKAQTSHLKNLEQVKLIHEALPEMNFEEVSTETSFFTSQKLKSPLFISSMTAGHAKGFEINLNLARLSEANQILMGVGSQRRELLDSSASDEWKKIRKAAPKAILIGNIGLAQAVQTSTSDLKRLVDSLEAKALFVHLNALQEVMQPEGTPQFLGGVKALERLVKELPVPVIVKETGCGFSVATLSKLDSIGVAAVDLAGAGGTHWGRIEGFRSSENEMLYKVAETYQDWGFSTLESMLNAKEAGVSYQVWASGGIRTGLDAGKMLAVGADLVGLALPFLEGALKGPEELQKIFDQLQYELKVAMFCTGVKSVAEFKQKRVWQWQKN